MPLERFCLAPLLGKPHSVHDSLDIVWVGEVVGLDGGVVTRIAGSKPDAPAALGMKETRGDCESGLESDAFVSRDLGLSETPNFIKQENDMLPISYLNLIQVKISRR